MDSGFGMTREVMDRLFEPFFTTKREGAGTGLGMAMVLAFSQQVNGRVVVATGRGSGTEVSLWLPRALTAHVGEDEPAAAVRSAPVRPASPAPQAQGRSLQVLVVEDDAAIRDIVVTILGMAGHRVLEAGDGEQAFDTAAGVEGTLDLLVTDIQLPGPLDGVTLSRVLVERYPALAVVYMSGDLTLDSPPPEGSVPNARLLAKPFRRDGLMEAVTAALGARAGA
nr:response regulator [Acetobacter okinawensis]